MCVYNSVSGMLVQVALNTLCKGLGCRAEVVISSVQAMPIWIISLCLGWEPFLVMQLFGAFGCTTSFVVSVHGCIGNTQRTIKRSLLIRMRDYILSL
jgi:hypothetical protein